MDIFEAIEDNDITKVKQYIDEKGDVNKIDNNGYSLLYTAYFFNKLEIFKLLISHPDIDVNYTFGYEQSTDLLNYIVLYADAQPTHYIEFVKLLLAHPDIDIKSEVDVNRYTVLHNACQNNYIEIIKLLLKHPNINVNIKTNFGWTPLHIACYYKIDVVKLLLKQPNIDVNIQDEDGQTPLHIVCKYNRIEVVKLLLKHPNIDVNYKNENEETPLYISCNFNHRNIVKLLLKNPKIKIDFDITEFWQSFKIYPLLKKKENKKLIKVLQILDTIED